MEVRAHERKRDELIEVIEGRGDEEVERQLLREYGCVEDIGKLGGFIDCER